MSYLGAFSQMPAIPTRPSGGFFAPPTGGTTPYGRGRPGLGAVNPTQMYGAPGAWAAARFGARSGFADIPFPYSAPAKHRQEYFAADSRLRQLFPEAQIVRAQAQANLATIALLLLDYNRRGQRAARAGDAALYSLFSSLYTAFSAAESALRGYIASFSGGWATSPASASSPADGYAAPPEPVAPVPILPAGPYPPSWTTLPSQSVPDWPITEVPALSVYGRQTPAPPTGSYAVQSDWTPPIPGMRPPMPEMSGLGAIPTFEGENLNTARARSVVLTKEELLKGLQTLPGKVEALRSLAKSRGWWKYTLPGLILTAYDVSEWERRADPLRMTITMLSTNAARLIPDGAEKNQILDGLIAAAQTMGKAPSVFSESDFNAMLAVLRPFAALGEGIFSTVRAAGRILETTGNLLPLIALGIGLVVAAPYLTAGIRRSRGAYRSYKEAIA